jgi:aryl-alcohol dehydrogenase-like predicted oxidoreductase
MKYKQLGRSGLLVSELCLGTMTFGDKGFWQVMGALGQTAVDDIIKGAKEAGINFIDTADVYAEGESEALLGQAIRTPASPAPTWCWPPRPMASSGPG